MPTLSSSAIHDVEYDSMSQILRIQFTSGSTYYSYPGVPERHYLGLISASSPGTYFNLYIRDQYR